MSEMPQEPEHIAPLKVDQYEFALQLMFYEGQISWQMNVLFVGLNIGIGTILQNKLDNFSPYDFLTNFMSILGLIINIFWLGTFLRNNKYYEFRMAQARHAEPSGFSLVNGRGYTFSKGKRVTIPATFGDARTKHKMSLFERRCSNKNAILISIVFFIIGFFLMLLLSFVDFISRVFNIGVL